MPSPFDFDFEDFRRRIDLRDSGRVFRREEPRLVESDYIDMGLNPFRPVQRLVSLDRGTETTVTFLLLCDSIVATKSKTCVWQEFPGFVSTPPKFYRKWALDYSGSSYRTDTSCTESYAWTDEWSINCDVSGCQIIANPNDDPQSSSHPECYSHVGSRGSLVSCSGTCVIGPGDGTTITNSNSRHEDYSCSNATSHNESHHHLDLTDEYTTTELITNVVAALPSYSGAYGCDGSHTTGQDCLCSAYRNLSADETSYTIRRFKYKFTSPSPATADYLIRWAECFVPELAADVTYMGTLYHKGSPDPDPAHWTRTLMSETVASGDSETSEHTCNEPTTDGTTSVIVPAAKPSISPAAGTYTPDVTVTLSGGSEIRYTLDGSDPTSSSTLYTTGILITATTTVKAIVITPCGPDSDVASKTYTITP